MALYKYVTKWERHRMSVQSKWVQSKSGCFKTILVSLLVRGCLLNWCLNRSLLNLIFATQWRLYEASAGAEIFTISIARFVCRRSLVIWNVSYALFCYVSKPNLINFLHPCFSFLFVFFEFQISSMFIVQSAYVIIFSYISKRFSNHVPSNFYIRHCA